MSRWTTLNIEGIAPDQLPEEFDDWWVYEKDGMTVAYTFNRGGWTIREAAAKAVEAGADDDVKPEVESILAMYVDGTSDTVQATLYRPKEVKWTGVKLGVSWRGAHSFRAESSEFLQRTPEGRTPLFAGNWTEYDRDGESPAVLLGDLRD